MTDASNAPEAAPSVPELSLPSRLIGVITSPKATFERIVPHPKVLGALAAVAILTAIITSSFFFSQAGQQAWLNSQAENYEKFAKQPYPPDQAAMMEKFAPYVGYMTMGSVIGLGPVFTAFIAGILYLIFTFGTGGLAKYKQVLAVTAHASIISVLGAVLATALQFMRGTITIQRPANLGVLVPFLPDNGFIATFLGTIDLVTVWWLFVLAIGLAVLYKKKTAGVAAVLFGIYGVIACGIAVFMAGR